MTLNNMEDTIIKKTILIVEDEQGLLRALKDKLTDEGFLILEAKNGQEGLNVAIEKQPDLILLDIVMPVMDGMTMLKELRQDDWGKKANVLLLTNLADEGKLEEVNVPIADYLIKSNWSIADIVNKIKEKLNLK